MVPMSRAPRSVLKTITKDTREAHKRKEEGKQTQKRSVGLIVIVLAFLGGSFFNIASHTHYKSNIAKKDRYRKDCPSSSVLFGIICCVIRPNSHILQSRGASSVWLAFRLLSVKTTPQHLRLHLLFHFLTVDTTSRPELPQNIPIVDQLAGAYYSLIFHTRSIHTIQSQ